MALIGINSSSKVQRQLSKMEQIAMGIDIASKVLGTALQVPEYLQKKDVLKMQNAESRANIGEKTVEATKDTPGAFEVPGMGYRKPAPSLTRQIQETTLSEKTRDLDTPTDQEYQEFAKTSPGADLVVLKRIYPTRGELKEAFNRKIGATTINVTDPFQREQFNYNVTQDEKKKEQEKAEKYVPTLDQYASTPTEAKETKEAIATRNSINKSITELITLRKKYGGGNVTNREDKARAGQIATKLLLKYKKLETLGVLSKTDIELIDKLVPKDPLELNVSGLVDQDPTMAKLEQLSTIVDDDYEIFLESRGFKVPDEIKKGPPKPAPNGVDEGTQDGKTYRWNGYEYVEATNAVRPQ